MKGLPRDALLKLQSATEKIRNVCILAHVDHGKTTLADCLVTVNGIISERLAGRLRYLDSLPDEEERGITMKSSAITLYYCCDDSSYLVNLIDTPGHVDFSGEVSTAVRLCDGAVIVVDVVEGVCSQTKLLLRQAWKEHIKAVLLLNKVDRLALELQLTPADAYRHLQGVVEQVNAVMGEIFISERIQEHDVQPSTSDKEETGQPSLDSLEESFYFDPTKGNVLFGSAYDGWGFDLETFAEIYAKKAGVNPRNLTKALWGDFYLNSKERSIKTGARKHGKKPLFVQLVLENLWHLYNTVVQRQDKEATIKLASSLHVDLTPRDQRTCDGRQLLQVVMSRWLPLCRTVLNAICKHLPNPKQMPTVKVRRLICPTMSADPGAFDSLPQSTKALEAAFQSCDSKATDVIAFVSKMFPVDPASIPENKRADMTEEERRVRRQKALQQLAGETVAEDSSTGESAKRGNVESVNSPPEPPEFIAFARVYSGEIRKGQSLYVLPPTHDPRKVNDPKDVAKIEISRLYLLMGREIESVDSVPAGNVCGIGGLQDFVLKSATLSTTLACSAFSSIEFLSDPIVRVAIEPMNPLDMPALVTGLKLLNQADPCIQTFIQETGEHVIVAAGEVHLERCVKDLQERYSQIEISVSEPIIPFLETVVDPPSLPADSEVVAPVPVKKERTALVSTANKAVQISIRAYPIPPEAVNVLSANASILNSGFYGEKSRNPLDRRTYSGTAVREPQDGPSRSVSVEDRTRIFKFKESLSESLKGSPLELLVDKLLCFGPKRAQYNMLLNASAVPQFVQSWFDHAAGDCPEVKGNEAEEQFAKDFALSAVHGFHISCLAGPICHEPLRAVAFVIQSVKVLQSPQTLLEARNELDVPSGEGDEVGRKSGTSDGGGSSTANTSRSQGPISGQLIAAMKDGCLKAFQLGEQRLVEAMYSCFIHAPIDMLGKVYSVLGRRRGRVVGEEMLESSNLFQIKAILPVVESFGFAEEIRKKTSGHAWPQLSFSHWEAMDVDPFWKPSTEEEIMDYTSNFENVARRHMNAVRRRKGLATDEQVVVAAEKQRTLVSATYCHENRMVMVISNTSGFADFTWHKGKDHTVTLQAVGPSTFCPGDGKLVNGDPDCQTIIANDNIPNFTLPYFKCNMLATKPAGGDLYIQAYFLAKDFAAPEPYCARFHTSCQYPYLVNVTAKIPVAVPHAEMESVFPPVPRLPPISQPHMIGNAVNKKTLGGSLYAGFTDPHDAKVLPYCILNRQVLLTMNYTGIYEAMIPVECKFTPDGVWDNPASITFVYGSCPASYSQSFISMTHVNSTNTLLLKAFRFHSAVQIWATCKMQLCFGDLSECQNVKLAMSSATVALIRNSSFGFEWLQVLTTNRMLSDSVLETIDLHWFEFAPTPMAMHTSMALFVAIVATVSTLGNALVVGVFLSSPNLRKGGIYTVNLALSDFLSPVLSYYLFTGTSFKQIWKYGQTTCVFYGFTQGFFGLMSIVTLAVISAERCYVILKPFKARDITSRHRLAITVAVWVYCALVAAPPVFGWSKYAPAGFLTSCCFDYLGRHWVARSFILYLFTLGFVIPVTVIVYSYAQIFRVVHKSEQGANMSGTKHAGQGSGKGGGGANSTGRQEPDVVATAPDRSGSVTKTTKLKKQVRKDIQMAKVMLIVILTFVLAWSPYAAIAIVGQFGPVGCLTPFAAMVPAIFAKTSTVYNPIIYAYKDAKFRSATVALFPFVSKIIHLDRSDSLSVDNKSRQFRGQGKRAFFKRGTTGMSLRSVTSYSSDGATG